MGCCFSARSSLPPRNVPRRLIWIWASRGRRMFFAGCLVRKLTSEEVDEWRSEYRGGWKSLDIVDPDGAVERALRNLVGYGPLEALLADDGVWEIMITVLWTGHVGVIRRCGRGGGGSWRPSPEGSKSAPARRHPRLPPGRQPAPVGCPRTASRPASPDSTPPARSSQATVKCWGLRPVGSNLNPELRSTPARTRVRTANLTSGGRCASSSTLTPRVA